MWGKLHKLFNNHVAGRKRKLMTYVTRLSWNLFGSTLREPQKWRGTVTDETTCAFNQFKFVKLGCATLRQFLQIS